MVTLYPKSKLGAVLKFELIPVLYDCINDFESLSSVTWTGGVAGLLSVSLKEMIFWVDLDNETLPPMVPLNLPTVYCTFAFAESDSLGKIELIVVDIWSIPIGNTLPVVVLILLL